jgi:hypothetical protein
LACIWRVTQRREQHSASELPKATLDAVAVDGGMLIARHDDSDAGDAERGSEDPHIEMCGPDSLPLSDDSL